MTPLRYQQLLRTERAEHLIGHGAGAGSRARNGLRGRPDAPPPACPVLTAR
jgi:hypothetical protein